MRSAPAEGGSVDVRRSEVVTEYEHEKWTHWPINWSAVWVGTLAAIAVLLLFGLIGLALGVHAVGPQNRVVDVRKFGLGALAFSIFGSFLAFVIGGWAAGKIAGILRSEPGMLHGAIVWLVAVPLLLLLASLGAGSFLGGWYAALSGTPAWAAPAGTPMSEWKYWVPTPQQMKARDIGSRPPNTGTRSSSGIKTLQERCATATLGAASALLLGLMGSVVGGWMASGEPMNFTYHRTRPGLKPGW